MRFEDYISSHKKAVYDTLCGYLPNKAPEEHYKMVREYSDRQGKYARPSLLLLWTELHGGKLEDAILPAAAHQLSEDWLLMHDDIEDGNGLRRGKPAAHVMYGERFAINSGDTLHMIMWDMVRDASRKLEVPRGDRFYDKFYDMLTVTAEGQYKDMHLTHHVKDITRFTLKDYYDSIKAKSGYYSVYGPMQLGSIIAGMDDGYLQRIESYGVPIGNAFQIKDDILDCTSTAGVLGKSVGNDVMDGVKTSILWHFVQDADASDLNRVRKIYMKERSEKTAEEVGEVLELFGRYGSVAAAGRDADALSTEALSRFEEVERGVPESDIKETARNAINALVARKK